jgi:hypothetical protein
MRNPFKYFKTSPEIIRLAVMMYIRSPLSLRNVEDLLHERTFISRLNYTPPLPRERVMCCASSFSVRRRCPKGG